MRCRPSRSYQSQVRVSLSLSLIGRASRNHLSLRQRSIFIILPSTIKEEDFLVYSVEARISSCISRHRRSILRRARFHDKRRVHFLSSKEMCIAHSLSALLILQSLVHVSVCEFREPVFEVAESALVLGGEPLFQHAHGVPHPLPSSPRHGFRHHPFMFRDVCVSESESGTDIYIVGHHSQCLQPPF